MKFFKKLLPSNKKFKELNKNEIIYKKKKSIKIF